MAVRREGSPRQLPREGQSPRPHQSLLVPDLLGVAQGGRCPALSNASSRKGGDRVLGAHRVGASPGALEVVISPSTATSKCWAATTVPGTTSGLILRGVGVQVFSTHRLHVDTDPGVKMSGMLEKA